MKIKINKKKLRKLSFADLSIIRETAKCNYQESIKDNDEEGKLIAESLMSSTKLELNRRVLKIWKIKKYPRAI